MQSVEHGLRETAVTDQATRFKDSVRAATDRDRHVESVDIVLVRLLDRLHREKRNMTVRERRRFSTGVRVLARCRGRTIAETITSIFRAACDSRGQGPSAQRAHRKQ
jgi:hypothetical protein